MVGIYKITSPSGRVYIGQSIDIERRFKEYKTLKNCKFQKKIFRSFLKYGVINHKFEIIEECDIELLNERERYYQELFNCVEDGLNCFYTKTNEKPRINSEEYKKQISSTLKHKYKTKEIVVHNFKKGRKFNIYDIYGNLLHFEITISEVLEQLKIGKSSINNMIRKNRFIVKKKFIVLLSNVNYKEYIFENIKKYNGNDIPVYQILENNNIKLCTISSKYRIIQKLLNSENYIYYSKKNKSYYTFIGLLNAVLDRNILDN